MKTDAMILTLFAMGFVGRVLGCSSAAPAAPAAPVADPAAEGASCDAWAAHDQTQCASNDPRATLAECAQGDAQYGPEGCGAAWSAYVRCASQASFSCEDGPTECDGQQSAYFACGSRFAAKTSCSRVPSIDATCGAATPFGFGCLGPLPSGCVQVPSASSASIACCAAFGPP